MRFIIKNLMENPMYFNSIRRMIAGDQKNTKKFIASTLQKYNVKSVLDVGCGTGDFCACIPKSAKYTGADLNPDFITYAKAVYGPKNRTWITQDVTEKAFYKNRKYDATLFISMLHHLSDEDLKNIMPAICRMTKKIIVIADIIPEPNGALRKLMVKLDQGHYIRPEKEKIKLLKKYGKVIHEEYIPSRLAVQYGILCRP